MLSLIENKNRKLKIQKKILIVLIILIIFTIFYTIGFINFIKSS